MNSPANGIFFPRPASLIGGMTRQATQGGRPRARPPPVLPKGGTRRGGSKVRERCKRATGRSPLTSGERTDGRPLLARKRERVWEATGCHVPQGRRRTHRAAPVAPRGFGVFATAGVRFSSLSRCAGQLSGGCCTVPHAPRRQRSRKLRNNNRLRPNSGGANPPLRVRYCAR